MSRLKELIYEIHRRSLWQVLGIYLASSWLVFEVVQTLTEGVGLPGWVPSGALVALLIGLPIVMATAFVQEGMGGRGAEPASAGPESPVTESAVAVDDSPLQEAGESPTRHRLFTWRNAVLGGAAAFMLLGVVTAGYMAMRTLGIGPAGTLVAKGVLEAREPILLAEFESPTGDSLLAQAVTEAFRVDLSQSEVARLAEPTFVGQALTRMERDPGTPLDFDLARELAVREGIPAVVGGEILAAGRSFILSARLVRATSGEELAAFRETAGDSSDVVPSIDRLSKKLREKIGESLRSVRREEALAKVTTSDLEALRKYSEALRAIHQQGEPDRGITLLREAVRLDSTFAMAWRKLGAVHSNRGEREEFEEALGRAYELKDHLTETERYLTEASYHQLVTEDRQAAITAYRNALERDPANTVALNNLGVLYAGAREFEAAAEEYERALAADSTNHLYYTNLAQTLVNLGRYGEAERVLEEAARWLPGHPAVGQTAARAAAARMAWDTARARFRAQREIRPGDPRPRIGAEFGLAALARIQGKLDGAWRHEQAARVAAQAAEQDLPPFLSLPGIILALEDRLIRLDPDRAAARADSILTAHPLEQLPEEERPHLSFTRLYGLAERPEQARAHFAAARSVAEAAGEPLDEEAVAQELP